MLFPNESNCTGRLAIKVETGPSNPLFTHPPPLLGQSVRMRKHVPRNKRNKHLNSAMNFVTSNIMQHGATKHSLRFSEVLRVRCALASQREPQVLAVPNIHNITGSFAAYSGNISGAEMKPFNNSCSGDAVGE